jgi:hypothetical protein
MIDVKEVIKEVGDKIIEEKGKSASKLTYEEAFESIPVYYLHIPRIEEKVRNYVLATLEKKEREEGFKYAYDQYKKHGGYYIVDIYKDMLQKYPSTKSSFSKLMYKDFKVKDEDCLIKEYKMIDPYNKESGWTKEYLLRAFNNIWGHMGLIRKEKPKKTYCELPPEYVEALERDRYNIWKIKEILAYENKIQKLKGQLK